MNVNEYCRQDVASLVESERRTVVLWCWPDGDIEDNLKESELETWFHLWPNTSLNRSITPSNPSPTPPPSSLSSLTQINGKIIFTGPVCWKPCWTLKCVSHYFDLTAPSGILSVIAPSSDNWDTRPTKFLNLKVPSQRKGVSYKWNGPWPSQGRREVWRVFLLLHLRLYADDVVLCSSTQFKAPSCFSVCRHILFYWFFFPSKLCLSP